MQQKKVKWLSVFICLLVLFTMDELLIRNRTKEINLMIQGVSQNVAERLDSAKSIVEIAAFTEDVARKEAGRGEGFLQQVVEQKPEMWSHFLMADLEGIEFAHTEGSIHYGKTIADREYFTAPKEKLETVIAQPVFSVSTGRKIIAIGTPVFEEEALSSVLVGFIHLQYVSQLINETSFTPNSYQMMVNADGVISAHPEETYVLDQRREDIFSQRVIDQMEQGAGGAILTMVEGQPSYVVFAPVGTFGLTIISVLPMFEAFATIFMISAIVLMAYLALRFIFYYQQRLKDSRQHANTMAEEAHTDSLTGLRNRQWLNKVNIMDFCKEGFTVIFIDVDNFKAFNDLHNHDYGDAVLKFIGESMAACTRPDVDRCIRYAGDEFIILLREADISVAEIIAQRLAKTLAVYAPAGAVDPITVSCGIATGKCGVDSLESVITKADAGVYEGKRGGKNQVVVVGK